MLNQFGKTIKLVRSENGTEFVNSECYFLFLFDHTPKILFLHPTTEWGGGRKHIHILELAREIRFQGSIQLKFWGHCVLGVVYMMNRLSRFEVFHGCRGSLDHFKTLGCLCYAKILPPGDKFAPRAMSAVNMDTQMSLRFMFSTTWTLITSLFLEM